MHDVPFTCHIAGAANGGIDGKAAGVAAQIQDTLASRQALHQGTAVPLIRIETCRNLVTIVRFSVQLCVHQVVVVDRASVVGRVVHCSAVIKRLHTCLLASWVCKVLHT